MSGQRLLVRPMAIPLEMGVRIPHIVTALRRVVRRHDALRMNVAAGPAGRTQVVAETREVEQMPVDADPEAYGALDLWTDGDQPLLFSIDTSSLQPMMRMYVHHALVDGWSCGLIMLDFYREYTTLLRGEHGATMASADSFGRYARDQRRRVAGQVLEAHNAFWTTQLRDAPPLALPYATGTWQPGLHAGRLPTLGFEVTGCTMPGLRARIPEFAGSGTTAILAAFAAAVTGATGQRDLVLHAALADRGTNHKRGLVGCLVNRVTLRLRLPAHPTARELAMIVRASWTRAARHQVGPFQRDGRQSGGGRILNLSPRVAVVVNDGLLPSHQYSFVGRPEPRHGEIRRHGLYTVWDAPPLDCTDDMLLSVLPRRPEMGRAEVPVRFAITYRPDIWRRDGAETLGAEVARWLARLR